MAERVIVYASSETDFDHVPDLFHQRTGYTWHYYRTGLGLIDSIVRDNPSLIVIDRDLADVSGDEITLAVKNDPDLKKMPVLMLISDEKSDILERCLLSGCDDYLAKPFDDQILMSKMARLLKIPYRRDPRILFRFWVHGKALSHYFFGSTKDISASGMLFTTDVKMNCGDIIEITFFIPASTRKVATTCKIVRLIESADPEKEETTYGVQFLQMERQSTKNLQDYLSKISQNQ